MRSPAPFSFRFYAVIPDIDIHPKLHLKCRNCAEPVYGDMSENLFIHKACIHTYGWPVEVIVENVHDYVVPEVP